MPRTALLRGTDGGLWVNGPRDRVPQGSLRRAKGVHPVRGGSVRSRWGSTSLYSLNAHSLYRFDDSRFQGVGGNLYRDGSSIYSALDGSRLSFARMPPASGSADYLFVAGGGTLVKVDTGGSVSGWGIAAPADGMSGALASRSSKLIDGFGSHTTWSGVNLKAGTKGDETVVAQSGTSMKFKVESGLTGSVTKSITTDLTTFGGGVDAVDEDYIGIWMRFQKPWRIINIQIIFNVGVAGRFNNSYQREIVFDDYVSRSQPLAAKGIADTAGVSGQERTFIASATTTPFRLSRAELMGYVRASQVEETWTHLLLPKSSFVKVGGSGTWADVSEVRIQIRATSHTQGSGWIYLDELELIGGVGMQGTYKYHVTFRNTTTGNRSNSNPTPLEVTDVVRQGVLLSNIPVSTDSQVDQREIWRTLGNGSVFFRCGTIDDNVTTSYTDTTADYIGLHSGSATTYLETTELPTDNTKPDDTIEDCFGPHNGAMFWTKNTASGKRGRVYYSPSGRPEGVKGFVEPTDDDDPTQKGVVWNGNVYVFSESKLFQIIGTDPYIAVEVYGVPGTLQPYTVVPTPYGIVYQAPDGIRIFDGAGANLAGFDALGPLFRGEGAEGIPAFTGTVAAFWNDEYIVSDGVTTLALDLRTLVWRNVGVGFQAIYKEPDTDKLVVAIPDKVLDWEVPGSFTDDGSAIGFELETPGVLLDSGLPRIIRFVFLDIDTNSQVLTPALLLDDDTILTLPNVVTTARDSSIEFPLDRRARVLGLRLTGNLVRPVTVYGVEVDVYTP